MKATKKSWTAKVALTVAFVVLFISGGYAGTTPVKKRNNKTSTQMVPNFSYPKNVMKDSKAEYESALNAGNGLKALEAAVKLCIAEGIVSADNDKDGISRFDELSKKLKSPYDRLALMLEAEIYLSVYENDKYIYNERALPNGVYPENIDEWSGNLFARKVDLLLTEANANISELTGYNLKSLGSLIENDANLKRLEKAGMSVADFIQARSADMLSKFNPDASVPLRFGDKIGAVTPRDRCYEYALKLLDEAIRRNESKDNQHLASWFSQLKYKMMPSSPAKDEWFAQCFSKYSDTRYGVWTIISKALSLETEGLTHKGYDGTQISGEDDTKINYGRTEALRILKKYLADHPDADDINSIKDKIARLEAGSVEIVNDNRVLTGKPWEIGIKATGCYDFSLLLFRLNDNRSENRSIVISDIASKARPAGSVNVRLKGSTPEIVKEKVTMPPLIPGLYVICPSVDGKLTGVIGNKDNNYADIFRVTDLSCFYVTDPVKDKDMLYVTDGRTQKPVEGAVVTIKKDREKKFQTLKTDSNGAVSMPKGSWDVEISYGNDYITESYYSYGDRRVTENKVVSGQILTDLSIYKPGEKVKFSCILWERKDHTLKEVPATDVRVFFKDANYETIDSLELTTDRFGRASGSFTIPETGLLGAYQLQLMADSYLGSRYIKVAEYKSPTFLVEIKGAEGEYAAGDTVRLKGQALTYTGLPVASAEVKFEINYQPWRFWGYGAGTDAACGGTTRTDSDGNFIIELPTDNLVGTVYENGIFSIRTEVTDAAGETQSAPTSMFALGRGYMIDASLPDAVNADDRHIDVRVRVVDMTGAPVDKPVYYAITGVNQEGKGISVSEYSKDRFIKDLTGMPSGKYMVRFSFDKEMNGNENSKVEVEVTLWRDSDKRPPFDTPLWVPETTVNIKPGENKAVVRFGSSYADSYIFMMVSDSRELKECRWIKIDDRNMEIEFDAPAADERLFVTLSGMHDFNVVTRRVTIIPAEQNIAVNIEAESFRDRISPGDDEEWKFRFTSGEENMAHRPVMAVMSNKALNVIAPFSWYFNPYGLLSWSDYCILVSKSNYRNTDYFYMTPVDYPDAERLGVPEWNFYGHSLAGPRMRYTTAVMYNMADMKAPRIKSRASNIRIRGLKEEGIEEESIPEMDDSVSENNIAAVATGSTDDPEIEFRPVELPSAFFMPDLVTDSDGMARISYKVPGAIGTWQFQIMGYDKDMHGKVLSLDAVAAKMVMVRMNAPRFLRTGDKAQISATIFNNSGEEIPVSGKIQVINPANGDILAEFIGKPVDLKAGGSAPLTIEYEVPTDISSVSVRAYAIGGTHTDGEQTEVAIFPSSTPVLESRPFYAAPGKRKINVSLPDESKNANVTLQYCGNPIWECITALPEILTPTSSNILAQVNALYGNAIAHGLISRYPGIGEAIRTFSAPGNTSDSTLVSPLQKNQNLKLTSLTNTPWVNDAADETRRMQALVKYLNKDEAEKSIYEIMKVIVSRQNNDGGWSWCDGMESSTFITGRVLLHFAMLKGLGYLPKEASALAVKGFRYYDFELVKSWKLSKNREFSIRTLLNYLYLKSFFPEIDDAGEFSKLRAAAISAIAKEWDQFGIYDKATAVTLEWRLGNTRLAGEILESLRQYASVNEEKGMWYDNLKGGSLSGWNPLITTAQVLEAFAEAAPKDKSVDLLRQWLLMSKQTQNWGDMNGTAEVINVLLTTGNDWTQPSREAEVLMDGKRVEIPSRAKLTDSFTVTVEATGKSEITIDKYSAGPAWGGIISQYVAPIMAVKADAIPQLSVRKEIFAIDADGYVSRNADNLKVGDKVRVTLTITCDRDMEYVTVTDSRSACLEPVDQLSGYTSSDGMWYYQETRNSGTNLFIPFLSKGSHVVNYECHIDRAGQYTAGIASAQSQYAPAIAAHSAGMILNVQE